MTYENLTVVVVLFSALFTVQRLRIKGRPVSEALLLCFLHLAALYLAVLFLWKPDWPGLAELLRLVYGAPAKMVFEYLKKPT
jgi:hypothetical protein